MKKAATSLQLLLSAIVLFLHLNLSAQHLSPSLFTKEDGIMKEFITLSEDQRVNYSPENIKRLLGLDNNTGLIFIRSSNDKIGMIHYRFYESFRGIPVANTMLIVHTKNNLITGLSGSLILDFGVSTNLNTAPLMSAEKGIQAAINFVKAEKYAWEDPALENKLKLESGNTKATFYPQATLSWFINDEGFDPAKMKLAYKINVYATQPLSKANYYIDAQTGVVISHQEEIFHSVVPGTAVTQFSGTKNINCEFVSPGVYQLRDMSRGNGLITLNGAAGNIDYVNNSSNWNLSLPDRYALDVHYGISSSYDFYQSLFLRNGIDGSGLMPTCYANKTGRNETNGYAVAIIYPNAMDIEFGNRTSDNLGFASIDLCGHEYTHGVVFFEGIISTTSEGEAITESLCDIMGKSIQFNAKPTDIDWRLGNDMNDISRYMSNPALLGHPKCYHDGYWLNNGNAGQMAHTNCEVGNYMYYLLVNGGTGTNCLGNSYCVSGIGLQEAQAIIYRTLTTYLTSGSVYSSWRSACIQAAADLYGTGSNQVEQVKNAWYAVGIGTTGIVSGALSAEIIGQSTFSSTEVCEDTWQYVEVAFSCSTGPYTVTICDNNNVQTVFPNPANPTPITSNTVRLFLPVNTNSHTFTLCGVSNGGGPGVITGNPTRSFNVVNCCPNLFVNGDFSTSVNYCDISPSTSQFNCSNVVGGSRREVFFSSLQQSTVDFGNRLFIDGAFSNSTGQCVYPNSGPPPNKNCICQTIDLVPCADYSISFFYYGDDGNTRFQIKINGQFIGSAIPLQVDPSWGIATINYHNDLLNGPTEICISEVNTICPYNDYVFDNITVRRIGLNCTSNAQCCVDTCDNFETGINDWAFLNSISGGGNISIQTPGASGTGTDHFLRTNTFGYTPTYVLADDAFLGAWCCGELCFDYRILLDNTSNSVGVSWNPSFEISNGSLKFRFTSSTLVNQTSGWQHICAPIGENGFDPSSSLGTWSPVFPTQNSDWNTVTSTVTELKFIIPAPSVYDGGIITGIDNVCLTPNVTHISIDASACKDSLCVRTDGCNKSFTYLWSDFNTSECIGNLIEGVTYSVVATDQNGSTYSASYTAPVRLHVQCFGGTINSCSSIFPTGQIGATITGGTGIKNIVVKSGGPNGPIVASNSSQLDQSFVFNGLTAGHYCIYVNDANGCMDSCCCDLLPFVWLPGKTQIPPLCNNSFDGSIDVGNYTNGNSPYSYLWSNGATTAGISNLGPGSYVVTITDFNGCSIVDSTTFSTPPPINPGPINGLTSLCTSTPQQLSYSVVALPSANAYYWTVPSGVTILTGQGTASISVSITAGALSNGVKGLICVTANDNCGAGPASCIAIDFNMTKPVTPPSISGPAKVCPGDLVTYSLSAVARATTYIWNFPAGINILSGSGTNIISAEILAGYTGGVLSVSAANVCGASPVRTKTLLQNIPASPGTISGPLFGVCGATGLSYSIAPVVAATSYQWTISGGTNAGPLNGTSVYFDWILNDSLVNLAVLAVNSCGSSVPRTATILGKPATAGTISGNTIVCTNGTYPYAVATVTGASYYTWTSPGGTIILSGQGTKNMTLGYGSVPAMSQSISVKTNNACGTSATRLLNGISINVCPRLGDGSSDAFFAAAMEIYPNPAHDALTILVSPVEDTDFTLLLLDITGRILYSEKGTGTGSEMQYSWEILKYARGVYFVQLLSNEGITTQKVVLE